MTNDDFDARIATGDLPPLGESAVGESDAFAHVADRLAAAMTAALVARTNAPRVTVNIAAPDAPSFRRSEATLAGQIARAVARGQRTQ